MGVFWIRLMLDSDTASRRRTGLRYKCAKTLHGTKKHVRALGFKNRIAAKRRGFKSRKLALAA